MNAAATGLVTVARWDVRITTPTYRCCYTAGRKPCRPLMVNLSSDLHQLRSKDTCDNSACEGWQAMFSLQPTPAMTHSGSFKFWGRSRCVRRGVVLSRSPYRREGAAHNYLALARALLVITLLSPLGQLPPDRLNRHTIAGAVWSSTFCRSSEASDAWGVFSCRMITTRS